MHNVRFKAFLIAGLLSVAALAADKDSKDSRPARGSVELGKGPGAQTSGSKVDELNNCLNKGFPFEIWFIAVQVEKRLIRKPY